MLLEHLGNSRGHRQAGVIVTATCALVLRSAKELFLRGLWQVVLVQNGGLGDFWAFIIAALSVGQLIKERLHHGFWFIFWTNSCGLRRYFSCWIHYWFHHLFQIVFLVVQIQSVFDQRGQSADVRVVARRLRQMLELSVHLDLLRELFQHVHLLDLQAPVHRVNLFDFLQVLSALLECNWSCDYFALLADSFRLIQLSRPTLVLRPHKMLLTAFMLAWYCAAADGCLVLVLHLRRKMQHFRKRLRRAFFLIIGPAGKVKLRWPISFLHFAFSNFALIDHHRKLTLTLELEGRRAWFILWLQRLLWCIVCQNEVLLLGLSRCIRYSKHVRAYISAQTWWVEHGGLGDERVEARDINGILLVLCNFSPFFGLHDDWWHFLL